MNCGKNGRSQAMLSAEGSSEVTLRSVRTIPPFAPAGVVTEGLCLHCWASGERLPPTGWVYAVKFMGDLSLIVRQT